MLSVPVPFPATGAFAFLSPTAERVRILRHNANDTVVVSRDRPGASGTFTTARDTLFETEEDAADAGIVHSHSPAPWRKVATNGRLTGRGRYARRIQMLECGHPFTVKGFGAKDAPKVTRRRCRECGQ